MNRPTSTVIANAPRNFCGADSSNTGELMATIHSDVSFEGNTSESVVAVRCSPRFGRQFSSMSTGPP